MASLNKMYFILLEKKDFPVSLGPGRICYTTESRCKKRGSVSKLTVTAVNSHGTEFSIDTNRMLKLTPESAELLQAVPDDKERLKWLQYKNAIQTALVLTVGTSVVVCEEAGELLGIIRYIGRLAKPKNPHSLPGTYFGIELQAEDRGKGDSNGIVNGEHFFSCAKNDGIFVPFSQIRPLIPPSFTPPAPSSQTENEQLAPGDRVTFFINDTQGHGMVLNVLEQNRKPIVQISTDTDENGMTGGELEVPLECVMKGDVSAGPHLRDDPDPNKFYKAEAERMDVDPPEMEANNSDLYRGLGVNSMVEVTLSHGNAFGIIRWIGFVGEKDECLAGLELEEDKGVSDGVFMNKRLFKCPPKKALFVKLSSCRKDSRFQSMSPKHGVEKTKQENTEEQMKHNTTDRLESVPPITTEQVGLILTGKMRGIQGHYNSCYMDSALFSLFSCSSILDSLLYKSTEPRDAPIQKTLLCDIVNPLRSKGFVEGHHIMKLRQQLQKHGYSHSFTTDEKDPEEFLTVIMHHILAVEPLLKLSAGGKVNESYCYQIFLDQKHSLVLPTVQQLLEHSLHSSGLTLAEVPSCLILQMPRFGKKFKMFSKIIPSLELDVTDLLSEGPQQCIICGKLASKRCNDCFKDPVFNPTGFKVFCGTCSAQVHAHAQRQSHQPDHLRTPKDFPAHALPHTLTRDKLELFAVLCIETSHYVSFIKYGPKTEDWIFFDSMADREGEKDGFNIPEVSFCPEVGAYLEMSPAELANQVPRDMKGVAKRLFCDAYMYLYENTRLSLYL